MTIDTLVAIHVEPCSACHTGKLWWSAANLATPPTGGRFKEAGWGSTTNSGMEAKEDLGFENRMHDFYFTLHKNHHLPRGLLSSNSRFPGECHPENELVLE
jgi:hypothetical protein